MIGKRPNAAPSSAGVERLPDRHRVDDDRDQDRDAERDQRGDCASSLHAAEQHEQRDDRQHREDRAQRKRVADRIQTCLYTSPPPRLTLTRTLPEPGAGIRRAGSRACGSALFITCFNDTLFPATGRRSSSCSSGSGTRSTSRSSRPAAGRCTTTPATRSDGLALARRFERVFDGAEAVVSPSASCVGHGPRALPGGRRPGLRADRVPRRPARRGRRRRVRSRTA